MKRFLVMVVCALTLPLSAFAADPPPTNVFIAQVAVGTTFEVESSKLALSRSKADPVRRFATAMVQDHEEAAVKFKKALAEAKLQAPTGVLDTKHKAIVGKLRQQDAASFDKSYIDVQYTAHKETVDLFEAYAARGENPRLKQFAQELLPTLRRHLEHVARLRDEQST